MKTTMVIPSYWAREAALGTKQTDAVYDHPTPLDEEGTLARALGSLGILADKDFELVVIAAANAEDVEERMESIAQSTGQPVEEVKKHYEKENLLGGLAEEIKEGKVLEFLLKVAEKVEEK